MNISFQQTILSILCAVLLMSTILPQTVTSTTVEFEQDIVSSEHLIENVSYVSQQTEFFCAYATPTMVFQYYKINTTLEEVLFSLGGGYGLLYSIPRHQRLPVGCIGTNRWDMDRSFLAELYGLSYEEWHPSNYRTTTQKWQAYWQRVKENISENIPVITNVDPVYLPSIRNAIRSYFNRSDAFLNPVLDRIWKWIPNAIYHSIVIVGYNESNGTVCIHDPASALYYHPEEGTYCWMELSSLKQSHRRFYRDSKSLAYAIEIFTDTENEPQSQEEIMDKAFQRNIQKINGEVSAYDSHITEDWNAKYLGIQGLYQMKKDFSLGLRHRLLTQYVYKTIITLKGYTQMSQLCDMISFVFPNLFSQPNCSSIQNNFLQIAREKHSIANFLETTASSTENITLSNLCSSHAYILRCEAANWTTLSELYAPFLYDGFDLDHLTSTSIFKQMSLVLDTIIEQEELLCET